MKPKTQPKPAPRAPKARVMNMLFERRVEGIPYYTSTAKEYYDQTRIAVIPGAEDIDPRALVRFANMTEEERLNAMHRAAMKATGFDGGLQAIHDLIFKGGAK